MNSSHWRWLRRRSRRRVSAKAPSGLLSMLTAFVVVASTVVVGSAGVASAQGPTQTSVEVPASAAGIAQTLTFNEPNVPVSISIPVPAGTTAQTLTGLLNLPANYSAGAVEVSSDGIALGTVGLPAASVTLPQIPFSVDISAAPVVNGFINLQLIYVDVP